MRGAEEVTDHEDAGPGHQALLRAAIGLMLKAGVAAAGTASIVDSEVLIGAEWGRPGAWARLAACRDRQDVNFFPDPTRKSARREVANAKAVCAACLVRQACAEAGLHERFGVWGGLDEDDRRTLRRAEHKEAS